MKLLSYFQCDEIRAGIVVDGAVLDLERFGGKTVPKDLVEFIAMGTKARDSLKKKVRALKKPSATKAYVGSLDEVRLAAPVPHPGKILALAGNYAEHIKEGGGKVVKKDKVTPRVFIKPATAVTGHGSPVSISRIAQFVDWEGELGVVIGRRGKYISKQQALQYVAGYTIVHDVSERQLMIRKRSQSSEWDRFFDWLNGKWQDGFAPMGPWLVTRDELRDPGNLSVVTRVNGNVQQNGNTKQMIFDVPDIVHYCSHIFTLEPGDVIATGTPSGIGKPKNIRLKSGDVVEIEIEGIGVLRNVFRNER